MFGLFYKYTWNRFSFAEYETKEEAKDAKKRLKKETHFKLQVRELTETKQAEITAYVWQWISTGEFFKQTEAGGNYHCSLCEADFLESKDAANSYADSFGSSFPRNKVHLAKIGVIN
jgi:hypothetical protein